MTDHVEKPQPLFLNAICLVLIVFAFSVAAQDEGGDIRGYKLYDAHVKVANSTGCNPRSDFNAFVSIGTPQPAAISLSGITIEVPASFCSSEHGGRVDFLTFRDFQINGIEVFIEEFSPSFQFSKNTMVQLPAPARIVIGAKNVLKTAYRELVETKADWSVTGTVMVFGKFKKVGFSFKRVVPVKIDIKIKNPLS